jgi:hypothetical protein
MAGAAPGRAGPRQAVRRPRRAGLGPGTARLEPRPALLALSRSAILSIAVLALPSVTDAAPPPAARRVGTPGLDLLPASAAMAVRVDPAELERAAELVRSLGGEVGLAASLTSLASSGALGFDALARAGWRSAGIDADQPILAAVGAIEPTAPGALWHVRAVAHVAEPRLFAEWAVRMPLLGATWRADRPERGALASLLGADASAEPAAARALTGRGTIAVGSLPQLGALVIVRRIGPLAALDGFAPAAGAPLDWARDRDSVLARLDARDSLAARATAGAQALARPGLVAWTHPAGMFDAALTWLRPPAACNAFRELAPSAALVDGSAALRIGPRQIALEITWGTAPGSALVSALAPGDDGLVGPPARTGAILAAAIHLAGTGQIRQLTRPALVDAGWVPLWRRVRGCGRSARALLLGFVWPELVAQWLSDVARTAPEAAVLIGAFRNVGFAARRVALERRGWSAVLEGSLAPAGLAPAEAIYDAVFGGRRAHRRPRPHSAWDGQILHPYSIARGARPAVVGVALGDEALAWRLRQALGPGRPTADLARVAGNASAVLDQLAPALAGWRRTAAAAAAARVGSFEAAVTVRSDAVRASLNLRRR